MLSSELLDEENAAFLTPAINFVAFGILAKNCLVTPSVRRIKCNCSRPDCVDSLRACNIPAVCRLKGFYYIIFAYASLISFIASFLDDPSGTWIPFYILVGGVGLLSGALVYYARIHSDTFRLLVQLFVALSHLSGYQC